MAADIARGDWQCPNPDCFNHKNFPNAYVYGSNVNCKKCGTGKTAKRAGDWCCPNPQCLNAKNTVYGSKAVCPKCFTPKPGMMAAMGGFGQQHLGFVSRAPVPSTALGFISRAPVPSTAPGLLRHGDWHCPNPVCKNHTGNVCYGSKSHCTLCGTPRPTMPTMQAIPSTFSSQYHYSPGGKGEYHYSPGGKGDRGKGGGGKGGGGKRGGGKGGVSGDWNCPNPNCKNFMDNFVYGSKPQCPLCGTPRPGMSRMEMTPMTRPGDWHCPNINCKNHSGNVVFASKSHCPLCMTPKPEDDDRERSRSPRGGEYGDEDFDIPIDRPYVDQCDEFGVYADPQY